MDDDEAMGRSLESLSKAGKRMIIDVFWRTTQWSVRGYHDGAELQECFRYAVAEARKQGYADDELIRYAELSIFPARYASFLTHVTKLRHDLPKYRKVVGGSRSLNEAQTVVVAKDDVQLVKSKLGQRHIDVGYGWSAGFSRPDNRDRWRGDHDLAHDFQDRKWHFHLSFSGKGISESWLAASEEAASAMWSQAIHGRLDQVDDYMKINEIHHIPRLSVPWLATELLDYDWFYPPSAATLQKAEALERSIAFALLEA